MDLSKLKSFCRIYERRSFSRAAQELFLSQPTVSAHVHSLETELGIQLFDRLGRGVIPTPAGRTLYVHARDVLQHLQSAQDAVQCLKEQVGGELHLGGSTIPGNHLLPCLMRDFYSKYPEVTMHLQLGDSQEVRHHIRQGNLDLAVVGAPSRDQELENVPLFQDQLGLVGTKALLEGVKDLELKAVLTLPWLIREQGSGTRVAWEEALTSQGLGLRDLRIAAVVHSTGAMLECAAAGLGLAVTSRLAAEDYLHRGDLLWMQLPELHLQREFYALRHKRRAFFPAAQKFWELLQKHAHDAWQENWFSAAALKT
ncbi:MAG: selenium metabolism-associated LysR family transcriptional regulator [Desulfohalobiaceae bacterium]